jgi:hypothetical protein
MEEQIKDLDILSVNSLTLTPTGEKLIKEYVSKASDLHDKAFEVDIRNQEDYNQAGILLKTAKEFWNIVETKRKSITGKIDSWKDFVMANFGKPKDMSAEARKVIDDKMRNYEQKKAAEQKAEQDRLAELARKESERLAKEAQKAENKGNLKKATELQAAAEETATIVPIVAPQIEKVPGLHRRGVPDYEITDFKAFLAYCLKEYPCNMIIEDSTVMRKISAAEGKTRVIPGVRFFEKQSSL